MNRMVQRLLKKLGQHHPHHFQQPVVVQLSLLLIHLHLALDPVMLPMNTWLVQLHIHLTSILQQFLELRMILLLVYLHLHSKLLATGMQNIQYLVASFCSLCDFGKSTRHKFMNVFYVNLWIVFCRERSRSSGAGEFMTLAPRGFRGEPITQAAELDFTDFVVLYKSFSLRARKDLREIFQTLAVTRKSLSDSSLEDPTSPTSPPSPAHRTPLSRPTLGLLTRNTSLDLLVFRNNCQKKKIFDAIAAASIITNCTGVESSKSQVRP